MSLVISLTFGIFVSNHGEVSWSMWIFFLWTSYDFCRNPTLAKYGGEAQHLEKVRIWNPPRLLNVQSSTERLKTPRIGVFLVSLERSWSVHIENGLALVIWTSIAQVMGKRRAGSQIGSLTPDHKKSGIDLFSTSELRPFDTSLERSRRGLRVWFRPRCNQTPQSGVMTSQSLGTPSEIVSGQFRDSNLGVLGKRAIWM